MLPQDEDRPPIGTECTVCRAAGHFCAATLYVGQTDLGICLPCREGRDCPTSVVRRAQQDDSFIPEPLHEPVIPARTIPREEWPDDTSIHESKHDLAEVPYGMRSIVRSEQAGNVVATPAPMFEAPAKKIAPKPVAPWKRSFLINTFPSSADFFKFLKDAAVLATYEAAMRVSSLDQTWFIEEKSAAGWRMLLDAPVFYDDREVAHTIARELSATESDKEVRTVIWSRGTIAGPAKRGRKPGVVYPKRERPAEVPPVGSFKKKQEDVVERRDQAKELLAQGATTREVANEVGMSLRTVVDVRREAILRPDETPNLLLIERVVNLKSGGKVALTLSIDFFTLSQQDRDFMFGIIDLLKSY